MTTYKSMLELQNSLVETYMLKPQGDEFPGSGLNLLVATSENIFQVDRERGVDEFERLWAIGSGSAVALGALEVIYDKIDDLNDIATESLWAACKYDLHSNESYQVVPIVDN